MAEIVLVPTSARTEGTGTANSPYVIATDAIGETSLTAWTDGLDSSYVKGDWNRSPKGNYPKWDSVPEAAGVAAAWVYAIGTRFRMTVGPDADGDVDGFIVQLFGQTSKLLASPSAALSPPSVGVFADYDYVWDNADYDTGGWAPNRVQSALEQTFIYTRTWPTDSTGTFLGPGLVKVSEQRMVLYYTPPADTGGVGQDNFEDTPPLRLTNRADQFSSARSLAGRAQSRQGSNRLTGYL